ncbi:MAG: hypothetical protein EPN69_00040 [Rhodanobacter sp.]|nr:MAG: hypothetical protein EPN71_07530 [Rhodanobacter sp.]TAL99573.1 MAG: hypothetical protein EPN69_00040 [Rhodanobacter sp.]TAM41423.1 MAG: hypothetical protein EPN58_06490 [Rhodanobacter sp.]TAN29341.1 MAG: hypothetical protein EPN32_00165 [Rhodanobacter sp.]
MWTLTTIGFWIVSFNTNGFVLATFTEFVCTLIALDVGAAGGIHLASFISGYLTILLGLMGWYVVYAELINETSGREVVPMFAFKNGPLLARRSWADGPPLGRFRLLASATERTVSTDLLMASCTTTENNCEEESMNVTDCITMRVKQVISQSRNNRALPIARRVSGALVALVLTAVSTNALAANPAISIVAPDEWNLPLFQQPTNIFQQTLISQHNSMAYDASGNGIKGPGGSVVEGISRFAHAWQWGNSKWGSFWEVFVPEVWEKLPKGSSLSGMGDPLLNMTVYYKPTKNSYIGFNDIEVVPVGASQVSGHAWANLPYLALGYGISQWWFQGTFGAVFPSSASLPVAACGDLPTCKVSAGDSYWAQVGGTFTVNQWWSLGLMDTWQHNLATNIEATNTRLDGSYENDIAPVVRFSFNPGTWVSLWYYRSIDGRNIVKTNALYMRFVKVL